MEIGPLFSPILRRPEANVFYLDHADTDSLRKKYAGDANVPVEAIVPIDIVWNGENLQSCVPFLEFDHVIAAHVCEHVPDLLKWFQELSSVLKPDGELRLIVPDRRFTFDFQRQESDILDVLAAYVEKRQCPRPREILDFWTKYQEVDCSAAWNGCHPVHSGLHLEELPAAMQRASEAFEQGVYHDAHCWVFTPTSFATLMLTLARLELTSFACSHIYRTAPQELDFFVHLVKTDDNSAVVDSWEYALLTDLNDSEVEFATAS